MKEKPILFSTPMVQAILAGRKRMTRRVVVPQPPKWVEEMGWTAFTPKGHASGRGIFGEEGPAEKFFKMPYEVGDRLWVRETWASPEVDKSRPGRIAYDADGLCGCWLGGGEDRQFFCHGRILEASGYRQFFPASGSSTHGLGKYTDIRSGEYPSYKYRWRSPMFMPRWAARLWLEVEKVRAERLQDIDEADAIAEGSREPSLRDLGGDLAQAAWSERQVFQRLWDHLNEKRGYGWGMNPWVWVVEFKTADAY